MSKKFNLPPLRLQLLLRFLPFVISLYVLGIFLQTQPLLINQMRQNLVERLGLAIPPTNSFDPLALINQKRNETNIPPLHLSNKLDATAKLLALALANDLEQKQFTLEQAATMAGYDYSQIAYLAISWGQPAIIPPAEALLTVDNLTEVLNKNYTEIGISQINLPNSPTSQILVVVVASPDKIKPAVATKKATSYYTGVELWNEIQKYRREHGVPEYRQDNTLCTLASIRINQLIELGKLDDHRGFEPLVNEYRQNGRLNFGNYAENILAGYASAPEAVAAWNSSLGHAALMRDGAYVWGCAAANYNFGVLIAAY